jgi:hypothetical protein
MLPQASDNVKDCRPEWNRLSQIAMGKDHVTLELRPGPVIPRSFVLPSDEESAIPGDPSG